MKFSEFAEHIEHIEKTASRLEITKALAELFKKLHADDIDKAVYLLQGRVGPLFEKIEFGVAEKMVTKSISLALQVERKTFETEYKKVGDLGKTLEHFKKEIVSLEEKDLTVAEVYKELYQMAISGGDGSQDVKIRILSHLIRLLDARSARYVVRIPQGVLRLGFSDMTMLDAFSWMITGDKSLRKEIEHAYHVRPDLGYIGKVLKAKGIQGIHHVRPQVFTPILMMRAERLSSAEEIVGKIGKCVLESKYDGFRLQIHYDKKKDKVKIYSRNLEEVSAMYPDIVAGVKKEVKADTIIFEGEAIGFDPHSGNFLPFQETVQRKRKYGIEEKAKEIPLKVFAFELVYLNEDSFISTPFLDRRHALEKAVKLSGDVFKDTILIAQEEITDDPKKIELYFDDAISKGLEGIVAKKMDGIYQPGARGWNWIKFKRSYSAKIDDTIDCLVMGYDYGKGKRADFGIGAFLAGIYDEEEDKFLTVAKIGTGLLDAEWRELKAKCEKHKKEKMPALYVVDKAMSVDVWISPVIIVEIKADEITRSQVHTAGRVMKPSKSGNAMEVETAGYALRFPRLQRFREDKRIEDVTTIDEVKAIFKAQGKK